MNTTMAIAAIIGSLVMGAIVGAIPGITGAVKGKIGLAIGGFCACVICNFILGLLLSIPACIIFMFLIFKKSKES